MCAQSPQSDAEPVGEAILMQVFALGPNLILLQIATALHMEIIQYQHILLTLQIEIQFFKTKAAKFIYIFRS
jgi:hypothetical protein